MANLYQDILKRSIENGSIYQDSVDARQWFRDEAAAVSPNVARRNVRSEFVENGRNAVTVGRLYMFNYIPKNKDALPYYDAFPVVFPFERTTDGFMGINLHYLPLNYRAILMDQLYTIVNNDKYDDSTRLQRLSYDILKSASRFRYYKPCLKHYLNSFVRSRYIYVHPKHWEIALFLPLEKFQKATKAEVFRESIRIIKGYK